MEPLTPSYDGANVSRIVPALLGSPRLRAGELPTWMPEAVTDARAVVLLVLDGLGWDALERHRSILPELSSCTGGPVTTVVPSTTAAALTSISTGLPPSEHGLVAFRMRIDEGVLNALSWHYQAGGRDQGRAPDPTMIQRATPFGHREVPVVTQSHFERGGFTRAHLRGGRFLGWSTQAVLVERCRRLIEAGERFVYAYYPGVDKVAHEFGLAAGYYTAELRATDALIGAIRDALDPEAVLVVTSDHGQVDVPAEGWRSTQVLEPLLALQAGDARFRFLYARPGADRELAVAASEHFAAEAWVLTREELIESGWLGPPPSGSIGHRIGDVTLVPRTPIAFADPALPRESTLRSAHGSLTPDEMLVPLLATRGRR